MNSPPSPQALTRPDNQRRMLVAGMACAVLLAAGCSRKNANAKGKALPKDATLLCLGDSLTYGMGATPGNSYPEILQKLTGHTALNAGISGDTAAGALERLPALLQAGTPGLVLVSIGANDLLRNMPLPATKAAIKSIVKTASAATQVVLIAQPKPDALAYAAGSLGDHPVYAEIAAETGVALFAGGWADVLSSPSMRSDQIHANNDGYRAFAERLDKWLRENKFLA